MALLRKKTDTEETTTGLENYYEEPGGWRVWARRVAGVVAALLLLAILIWAATWVWGAVTGDDAEERNETNATQEVDGDTEAPAPAPTEGGQGSDANGTSDGNIDENTNGGESNIGEGVTNDDTSDDSASGNTGTTGTSGSNGSSDTDTLAKEGTADLPATGPAGAAALVGITSVLGAAGHSIVTRFRSRR